MPLDDLQTQILAWTLLYGYPILALTLLIGAIGIPLPASLVATVAGTLVASDEMNPLVAVLVATVACILGDLVGYGVGRWGGREIAKRYGWWIGVNPSRLLQTEALFRRWAGPTLLLSRSLLAIVGPAVNLLAGVSREGFRRFLLYDTAGRLLWVVAYIGLGYLFAGSAEGVVDFLSSLSGVLGALVVAGILAALASQGRHTAPAE